MTRERGMTGSRQLGSSRGLRSCSGVTGELYPEIIVPRGAIILWNRYPRTKLMGYLYAPS